ncbi:MAG: rhomboid family intramembrane serine protease [Clostridiales bacterium]|jgi:membrane associated rhomboid family serine protease|nr:rhomboid family intramembrane serine protease [Clostridiales bacterium]
MYEIFVDILNKVLVEAGCVKINMPADLPRPARVDLWGREHGAMAYFYITYDVNTMDFRDFPAISEFMAECLQTITERISARHAVAFNIFVGDIDYNDNIYINTPREFALMPQYDMFFGVRASGVAYSRLAPVHMDKALEKIEAALAQMPGLRRATHELKVLPQPKGEIKLVRSTAHRRTPDKKPGIPFFAFTLIGINVLMFILMEIVGSSTDSLTLLRFGAAHFALTFGQGEFWRLFTPMFLHIGLVHLVLNTAWLVLAGPRTERVFGHAKFIAIYLSSGIIGNVASMLTSPQAVGAGASGAIFGILGALLAYTVKTKKAVETFTTTTLGFLIGINIAAGLFMPNLLGEGTMIGNAAHIGGLISGFILGAIFVGKKPA